ncbi:5-formyltetrahydrofolate cyclo-ligase [Cupriavidus necator]|uniref:5-formyltetrahydrofolate cyclo-ligase n=1 Tax=Cupriavidus necator (strain ATCC 17699 / DSM 428 / KCTC 22496 / NCIMB 10442 / H16 / Stanier 337) TaxID=381666 RepID=Q0KF20_CUPNH|nr:5-formyltetrahydrofolate cyclo-ligase [Cupriavidus necator]KUE85541.1 5-formyltetrahydrofolate cyclo-ligase [Cupriavidus necator]QCB99358.1 5-formyltetrahydrofolate cyclo-ligase [Cupriavidus necator H16]QQB77825.1 5-formyltetrahydrofolate cyclo-ligase [Cupriavidus necator]WKA41186.1 5-formyltetrahydrofolate cyclo-ligase [Cupriavidus necator]CAJ91401.1 5-Formyltetrahydrofolate cyclo-ligase [Cupriavidus necator H16]
MSSTPATTAPTPAAEDRRALRTQLLAQRAALPARAEADARIAAALSGLLAGLAVRCLGFYWPIQQEFDARDAVGIWLAAMPGRSAALPSVSRPGAPLDFHLWTPDTPMATGHYGIPVPDGTEAATPDALLIPCVGFSPDKFRLGYGGGFYDRTLAAMAQRPVAIGIGYENCRAPLQAQPHDIAMDWIVTESGAF